ncbi:hypothetical protein FA13DRAFT_260870 [Coprinellus micaceus]|uniref:Nephrocystin 3-like N-terminal domain-containing protein n=1 Tax=Coprinellus micaceus TaxID=71717 RepID=A0A4Y7TEF0_COPMI|nr:hypothetical protein FA13DRAFT_260870 [Coprinellus micaceus]
MHGEQQELARGHHSHYHGNTCINTTVIHGTLNRVHHVESASFSGSGYASHGPSPVQGAAPWIPYTCQSPTSVYHAPYSPLLPILDASHTRNRRTSPPDSSCLPGTRKIVLEKIMAWVQDTTFVDAEEDTGHASRSDTPLGADEDPFFPPHLRQILSERDPAPLNSQHVLWLCGPVGCGKSAIAQTAAEELDRQGRLAASFFFFRGSPARSRMSNFVVTLASQIAVAVPATRSYVDAILESPNGTQGVSVSTQIQKLVLQPLQAALLPTSPSFTGNEGRPGSPQSIRGKWKARIRDPFKLLRGKGHASSPIDMHESPAPPNKPLTIVIDGVDECIDHEDVTDFIDHILDFFKQNPFFPLRFLINSRIEEHIREHIETDQVHVINLSDHAYDEDIEALVRHTFGVAAQRSRVIRSFGKQWPSEFYIRQLVWQAGGSFMFIKTMLNYILGLDASRDDGLTPIERLKLALKRKVNLDAVYSESLQRVHHIDQASKVVLTIALLKDSVSINNLTHLLSLPAFKIVNALIPLQAIIRIPGNDIETITLFHPSLRDYILDPARSMTFSGRERDEQTGTLARRCIELQLSEGPNSHPGPSQEVVDYAAEAWPSLWAAIPRGSEWVKRDLDFLVSFGRSIIPNCFDTVFSLFSQGVDVAWQTMDRQNLLSFTDHFPGTIRLWHAFPRFRPQFEVIARALCALVARDADHLVLELRSRGGGAHHGTTDASLQRCMVMRSMQYIFGDEEPTWSAYDGPCWTYILLYWTQHLSLVIEDSNDLAGFLREKYSPRSTIWSGPSTHLTGIQLETAILSQNLERALSLIYKKLPNLGNTLTHPEEDVPDHTLIYVSSSPSWIPDSRVLNRVGYVANTEGRWTVYSRYAQYYTPLATIERSSRRDFE